MSDKKNWKHTLNLPETEFPMKANLPQREPEWLAAWEKSNLYGEILERSNDRPRFDLHDGPPYANGEIHIGHALNKILKDFVVKSRSMMGYRAAYIPGWDCHGLPIEHKVDKKLGKKKRDLSASEFRLACREFAEENLDLQRQDFIRLGVLGQWDRPYKTMDHDYEAEIARTLGRFFEKGLVYKGLKPVHWCTRCQTALAEAEVEYDDKTSPSIYVRFETDPAVASTLGLDDTPLHAVIWTTTPWTIPANLAIALHPDLEYSVIDVEAGRHIIASELVETVSKKLAWKDPKEVARFRGGKIEKMTYRHPIYDREGLFVLGDYVTLDAGTGLVHTAPGHGVDDFNTGRRYDLEVLTPVDHKGLFTSRAPQWEGEHVYKANPLIIETLTEAGALLLHEDFHHSYPHCWRCNTPVIFRATEQWFIAMNEGNLRKTALEQIEKVAWYPRWGYDRMSGMVTDRPDWCISRQRLWGVPITVLYCESCDQHIASPELFANVVAAFREHGADVWFERDAAGFLPEGTLCQSCGGSSFRKETDILDVWFDSGASHIAVSEDHDELKLPVDLYLEGHDQHRGWFQSSLLIGCGTRGETPYKGVITHGFVVDENGRKMSKSLGNVVSPQQVIKQHGADVLRLWVSMVDYRGDIAMGPEIIARISESYRKIRNTARFLIANLSEFDPATDFVPTDDLEAIDRWIIHRAAVAFERCLQAYEQYEFHTVYHRLLDLCTVDLSAIYSDIVKDRLYVEGPSSRTRRSAQTAMYRIAEGLATVIAPILAFTADEIWKTLPGDREDSVHLASFADLDLEKLSAEDLARWDQLLELREAVTGVLEKARARKEIGQSLAADVVLNSAQASELIEALGVDPSKFFIVSHVDITEEELPLIDIEGLGKVGVGMKHARGLKCGRCWHFREEVAGDDGLCNRCTEVVESLTADVDG